jgi:hypothetical protein
VSCFRVAWEESGGAWLGETSKEKENGEEAWLVESDRPCEEVVSSTLRAVPKHTTRRYPYKPHIE